MHRALVLFNRVATQWRTGPSGLLGLDYTAPVLAQLFGRRTRSGRELLAAVQVIENEILTQLSEEKA